MGVVCPELEARGREWLPLRALGPLPISQRTLQRRLWSLSHAQVPGLRRVRGRGGRGGWRYEVTAAFVAAFHATI